ncbi:MAG: hypothetical protein UV98_C0024G0012 [Parcubacteria group bacterium GW2011_GWB1_43_6]|uniref:Uncharacterized protein n=1 Tax=Candidatus Giovannonibacteria bacterium GW2011_GWA2_45_21 TaxID=1618649 RepID=A0A0G1Q751_9BACT|nr:MAG: hypothetical protein UV98_C0024G0012 [Parcubacteria group bacterium GW2011_GWB1_43_6]KKU04420.1 MAG: hypothetical protein UX06_C0019G0009 [Candidatus Giovannonibacteria bacterium GW2011_GWA2_45_21]
MVEKGILREFFGSLSADVITKYFLPNVFKKSGEKIDQALEKRLDDECRKTFAMLVSKMSEPWRTKMNEHYRKATATYIENKMAWLLMAAVAGCATERDKLEYFQYVAMLNWDKPREDPVDPNVVYPCVLEELDKLDHDPIPEFFQWVNEVASREFATATGQFKGMNDRLETWLNTKKGGWTW